MNFKESLDYLFGLGYERSVKKFGLENTFILLNALGNPQNNFIKVQVAGTNGKGSTCAFLESICIDAGIAVGVNTSPHLVSVTERLRVDGVEISEELFASYATKVRRVSEELVRSGKLEAIPTFFEHITVMAQVVFADKNVGVAILETGLGGRFDATTATRAEIVAFTQIDLDHTKTLGDTIEKIAAEKAEIIREGVRVVVSTQKEKALRIILAKCREKGVNPRCALDVEIGSHFCKAGERMTMKGCVEFEKPRRPLDAPRSKGGEQTQLTAGDNGIATNITLSEHAAPGKAIGSFHTQTHSYEDICLNLPGGHQIENAVVAILLAETLQAKGFRIASENIKNGLESAAHNGRLEYSDGILFDGAHNVSGAQALREYVTQFIDQPITMIFAAMGGKDLKVISQILFSLAENLILTTPENPRAARAQEIAAFVPGEISGNRVYVIDDVAEAMETAHEIAGDGLILVTGSLYLIGEVQANLRDRKVERRKAKR